MKQGLVDVSTPLLDDEIRRRMRVRGSAPTCRGRRNERALRASTTRSAASRSSSATRATSRRPSTIKQRVARRAAITHRRQGRARPPSTTTGRHQHRGRASPTSCSPTSEIRASCFATRHAASCKTSASARAVHRAPAPGRHPDGRRAVPRNAAIPAVRVRTDFDPLTSFDRRDEEGRVRGHDRPAPRSSTSCSRATTRVIAGRDLRKQLTFNQAASSDDVEASESAKAIAAYLQSRGYFDARVTWIRERVRAGFDRIIVPDRAGQAARRSARSSSSATARSTEDAAARGRSARASRGSRRSLFGRSTRRDLAAARRRRRSHRRISTAATGYRDARVRVSAATDPAALDSAALAAALVLGATAAQDLYVRFTIDEGAAHAADPDPRRAGRQGRRDHHARATRILCTPGARGARRALRQAERSRCRLTPTAASAIAPNLKFRRTTATDTTRPAQATGCISHGRPRAKVDLRGRRSSVRAASPRGTRSANVQRLKIGKVVIRGNFRTRDSIILGDCSRLDARASRSPRTRSPRARAGCATPACSTPSTSRCPTSRTRAKARSTRSSRSPSATTMHRAARGRGRLLELQRHVRQARPVASRTSSASASRSISPARSASMLGEAFDERNLKLRQLAAEAHAAHPAVAVARYVPGRSRFQTELSALPPPPGHAALRPASRTDGVTLALSRTWRRQRIGTAPRQRACTVGLHYDFRLRERPVDVLRPLGADDDRTQVPITTRTGSVGVTVRVGAAHRSPRHAVAARARGRLPPRGPDLVRVPGPTSAARTRSSSCRLPARRYWPLGDNLVLRADLRYDQGIPLGGAVLLPEVERFFAGGDSTVRGYEDDRLATEIIQIGVPPIDNVAADPHPPGRRQHPRDVVARRAAPDLEAASRPRAFVDAGLITNQWTTVDRGRHPPVGRHRADPARDPVRPVALERAVPLRPAARRQPARPLARQLRSARPVLIYGPSTQGDVHGTLRQSRRR